MQEPTREQEAVAEALANQYGSVACQPVSPDGSQLLVGISDDVEREFLRVLPDGTKLPGAGVRFDLGLKVISRPFTARVEIEEAARQLLKALEEGYDIRIVAMVTDGRERPLTALEAEVIVRCATLFAQARGLRSAA